MIKVIVERHVKKGVDIAPLLRELRTAALHHPGYITGETMFMTEDKSVIAVLSTWRNLEDWKAWEKSETRAKLYQHVEPFLVEKPKVRTYQILATEAATG